MQALRQLLPSSTMFRVLDLTLRLPVKPPFSYAHSQACKCKLQHFQSSHLHSRATECSSCHGEASETSTLGQEKLSRAVLQPLDSISFSHCQDAVQRTCDAHGSDSGVLHSRAPLLRWARCKGQKKLESLGLLQGKVSVLESCQQVSPAAATALRKSRAFKSASLERLAAVLKVLTGFLGSNERAFQALVASPRILYKRSELLEQKLTDLAHSGVREEVFQKMCTSRGVLARKLESLHKTLSMLEEIGPSAKARNKILWVYPSIVCMSGFCMLRGFDFFKSLGMNGKEISQAMERQPSIFMCSADNLIRKYTFFRQLGFTVKDFRKIICAYLRPFAIGTCQAKIKFLKDQGISDSDVHLLILRGLPALAQRPNVLKSKLDYLLREHNYAIADIVRCPACLSVSLEGRMIPRLMAVKERGLFKGYALSTILICRDVYFQKLLRPLYM